MNMLLTTSFFTIFARMAHQNYAFVFFFVAIHVILFLCFLLVIYSFFIKRKAR